MTSAPRSARYMLPKGPAPYCSMAMMRTPSRGGRRCADSIRLASAYPLGCTALRPYCAPLQGIFLEQAARDDQALDLIGAFANSHQRSITVVTLDLVLFGIPIAAVDAHGL